MAILSGVGVSADTLSVSQTVVIQAVIAPARYLVVNDSGRIMSIMSNTDQSVIPTVYLNNAQSPTQPFTPALQKQYQQILAAHKGSFIGALYSSQPKPITSVASLVKHDFSVVSTTPINL